MRLSGQDYSLRNFTVKEGLPSQEVYCALQDHRGQMWFGTDAGVSVYNGFHFTNYSTRDGLLDNSVFAMHEDEKQRIWFGVLNRRLFYYENNCYVPARDKNGDTLKITQGHVNAIYSSGDTIVYAASYRSYFLIQNGPYFKLDSLTYFPGGADFVAVKTKQGKYIFTRELNLKVLKPSIKLALIKGKQVIYYTLPAEIKNVPMYWSIEEANGFILFHFGNHAYILFPDGTVKSTAFSKNILYSAINKGNIELRFEGQGIRTYRYDNLEEPLHSVFQDYTITGIVCDHENGYWFTTLENGILYSSSYGQVIFPPLATENINIRDIKVQDDALWVASKTGNIRAYDFTPDNRLELLTDFHMDKGEILIDMAFLKNSIYIAKQGGLLYYTINNHQLSGKQIMNASGIRELTVSGDSLVYAVGRTPLYIIRGTNFEWYTRMYTPEAFHCYATGDSLLIGSTNGLYVCRNREFRKINLPGINPLENIHAMLVDRFGRLYAGTEESGLVIKSKNGVQVINKDRGLISNNVTGLVINRDSIVWVSTKSGLSKVLLDKNAQVKRIENFDITNGLINDNITAIACYKSYVCLGTRSGFFAIHENDLQQNNKRPLLFIDRVENLKAANKNGQFGYNENDFRLHISASSFRNAGNIPVKYKLRKEDTTFYYQTISKGTLTLLQLEPGDYEISIYAANNNGMWSEKPAVCSFSIAKPFWQQAYFWLLFSVVVLLAVLLIARVRVRQITRREKEKAEFEIQIENLKNQALRLQMNPHFLFNALNAIQGFYANENKALAKNYIYNLSRLLRLILESSKQDEILLENEIEIVRAYLDLTVLRFEDKLDYTINVADGLPLNRLNVPPMILQPFIENAFIHGIAPKEDKGHIDVSFRIENEQLICTITDNGVGRKASAAMKLVSVQRSSGINITRERIALLNKKHDATSTVEIQDLADEDGKAAGTRVILKLTLKMDDHA